MVFSLFLILFRLKGFWLVDKLLSIDTRWAVMLVGGTERALIYASLESRPRPALHKAAILMFILPSGNTQHTHPKLPRMRGGGERDRERDRDSDDLSLTLLSRSPHGTRAGGDPLLGSGGRPSLSSLKRPPSRSRSRSRSRSVRRWVHMSAIRIVTYGRGGGRASSDSGGRTPPRRKRGATRGMGKSAGGGGGSERSAFAGQP